MEMHLSPSTFSHLLAAGTPLIFIITASEKRTERLIKRTIDQRTKETSKVETWDCAVGFAEHEGTEDPLSALRWALKQEGPRVFIFKDLYWFWKDNPYIQRTLKDIAASGRHAGKTFVFLGPEENIPAALKKNILLLEHALPDRREIVAYLKGIIDKNPSLKNLSEEDSLKRLAVAAQGLDLTDIEHALRLGHVTHGENLDEVISTLHQHKKQVLQKSGIMEFVDNDIEPDHVGGMNNLKAWMEKREKAFGAADLQAGRNLPRGVLMMGISGCGKSLFVKAIAARWHLPLVRLDMATVYAGTFGSPETSLREACKMAETLAPCVLWIDEIEAGISTQGFKAEGGEASRVLGYFLTWMQEKRHPVFVAATANAIEMLPAELLRKGRFDEIFYIALPEIAEREEIFRIHLQKRGFDPADFQLSMLAHSAKGFSGAEIEQAVASAAFEALAKGRTISQHDVMEAISRTVPLSITMAEQIKKIEAWAFKRAVPAGKSGKG